jgi:hypothetical protein
LHLAFLNFLTMPAKLITFPKPKPKAKRSSNKPPAPLTMPAVASFLRDTRGLVDWTASDLAKTLGANLAQANAALPLLSMQGYIKSAGSNRWLTTIAGEQLSGSVTPRFEKAAIDRALGALNERVRSLNKDSGAEFTVTRALAFGDFLGQGSRVQAAQVALQLKPRTEPGSALALRRAEEKLFTALRGRSPMLHVLRFEDWMSVRTHRKLL